jgi:methionyl-tRNA synthetase
VPVPWDPEHVFYVWFDALLNYYTALGYARDGEDLTERFWPASFHVIGKDILKFHTVFWPAMLMAAGIELPEHVFVHGFLLSPAPSDGNAGAEGATELEKMSKSRGNVIDPFGIVETFGADALRFYCAREVSFGQDGPVSEATFATRYETELANELGNLASRTLSMVGRYREGRVPAVELDPELAGDFEGLAGIVRDHLDRFELSLALDAIWRRVRRLNRYVEERAPWRLAKDPERAGDLDRTLASLTEGLRVVAVLLHAYLPESTSKLLTALAAPDTSLDTAQFGYGGGDGDRVVGPLDPLFPKR